MYTGQCGAAARLLTGAPRLFLLVAAGTVAGHAASAASVLPAASEPPTVSDCGDLATGDSGLVAGGTALVTDAGDMGGVAVPSSSMTHTPSTTTDLPGHAGGAGGRAATKSPSTPGSRSARTAAADRATRSWRLTMLASVCVGD